jgi:hypothetical protein
VNTEDLAFLHEHVSTIDGQRPERLDEVRRRIHAARRRRSAGRAVAASVVAIVAVIGIVLAGGQTHPAGQEPVRRPSTPAVPGGEALAQNPYLWWMAPGWHLARQKGAVPLRLTHCDADPGSWGAVQSQVAVYRNPHHPEKWVNEFLLQYPDASSAHQALLSDWRQLKDCPRPAHTSDRRGLNEQRQQIYRKSYDEGFSWARVWPNFHPFDLRCVARAGNVLVVLEGTVWDDDGRIPYLLAQAVRQAVPQYVWSR